MWNFINGTRKVQIGNQRAALTCKLLESRIESYEKAAQNHAANGEYQKAADNVAVALGLKISRGVLLDEFKLTPVTRKRK